MYALPVALFLTPAVNELTVHLEERMAQKAIDPVPDPRLAAQSSSSGPDTLISDVKFYLKDHPSVVFRTGLGNTRVTYVPYLGTDPVTSAKCQVRIYVESVIDCYPYRIVKQEILQKTI